MSSAETKTEQSETAGQLSSCLDELIRFTSFSRTEETICVNASSIQWWYPLKDKFLVQSPKEGCLRCPVRIEVLWAIQRRVWRKNQGPFHFTWMLELKLPVQLQVFHIREQNERFDHEQRDHKKHNKSRPNPTNVWCFGIPHYVRCHQNAHIDGEL